MDDCDYAHLPALCVELALLIQLHFNIEILEKASKDFSFTFPQSMTYTTSSIVIEVSAIFVANIYKRMTVE